MPSNDSVSCLTGPEQRSRSTRPVALEQHYNQETAAVVRQLAHDFGNILTSILGFSELAMAELRPEAGAKAHVAEIRQAAQKGAAFVQELRLRSNQAILKGVQTW